MFTKILVRQNFTVAFLTVTKNGKRSSAINSGSIKKCDVFVHRGLSSVGGRTADTHGWGRILAKRRSHTHRTAASIWRVGKTKL